MKFSIDPVVTGELLSQFASQLDGLDDRDVVVARLEELFAGDRDREFYEGLLAGYANAFSVVDQSTTGGRPGKELGVIVAFVAAKLLRLRPSLDLRCSRCRLAASGRDMNLPPADFAFYALLARRRTAMRGEDGFVSWDTPNLLEEYLQEYRRTTDELNGNLERVTRALRSTADEGEALRKWFEERKSRVNGAIRKDLSRELGLVYCIESEGRRPNVRSGLAIDPGGIGIHD